MGSDDPRDSMERLDAALTALETAVSRASAVESSRADLAVSLAAMDDDRQRLAADLDAALARNARMDAASAQVEARLSQVSERLAAQLDRTDDA